MKVLNWFIVSYCLSFAHSAVAKELEVIHWWSSGSEAKSVESLKSMFQKTGFSWKDSKIIGGGGDNAGKAIKQRVSSGDAPGVVQLKSASLPQWGALGALQSVNSAAKKQNWDKILPADVVRSLKYKGNYVSVPINVHRINWLWMNKSVLDKAGAKVPSTMEELYSTLDKIKKTGVLPLAHGGQPWQDATLFEEVVLGVGGPELYRKVLVDLDPSAAKSGKMKDVFKSLRKLSSYMAKDRKGLDWDKATKMVIDGKAGMQFMGDWAKGEFLGKGKKPGKDFICVVTPGSSDSYIYTIDSFAFFKTKGDKAIDAQNKLAELVMTEKFQLEFNKRKGSIPVRTDIDLKEFDSCALESSKHFMAAGKTNSLVPSFAHGNAQPSDIQNAIVEVSSLFLNSNMTPENAVSRLASVLEEFE